MGQATPMMQQYVDVKHQYPDYILLYRLGDFYEMFFDDAVTASRALELTLTGRDCGDGRRAAMCGVQFHKVDVYVGRLIEKGYKAAICEQMEDPATAKGLVRREVIRVVTPGTVTDAVRLPDASNNYLAAVSLSGETTAVAFADVSTGQVYVTAAGSAEEGAHLLETELGTYAPTEALLDRPAADCRDLCDFLALRCRAVITDDRADLFETGRAREDALACFGEEACRDLFASPSMLRAVGALLAYLRETQKVAPTFLRELHVYTGGQFVEMDLSTTRNLELTQALRTGEKRGTLLWVLDKTVTAMGARRLKAWIRQPLRDVAAIRRRQSAVAELCERFLERQNLRELLSPMLDIERLTAKAVYGTANARDLFALSCSLRMLPELRRRLDDFTALSLRRLGERIDPLTDLCELLDAAIREDAPLTVREGGMIRDGYDREVDRLRSVREGGGAWMKEIEEREIARSGIRNLRVGYNKVFGYYLEVTKSQTDQVPADYVRKQTLTGCERYITQELKEMEATVLGATERLCALEYELFVDLRDKVAAAASRLQQTAGAVADLDVLRSFADVAVDYGYSCPEVDLSTAIEIKDGRHPVVERFLSGSYFVPNDTALDADRRRLMLITGPNMAGKSTYMRQVALIVLMAQIGSFVPAADARIGLVDRVFTRVGASDDLAAGQSTFMLEMTEVSRILRDATARSLVVYDEVGRGTSTYDGMSIARAVAEYTAKKIGARAMFATHYHELTDMEGQIPGVFNCHIVAKKKKDDIVFLRKIVPGATDDSYGIEVAKMAGVPAEVVRRARDVLASIESGALAAPRTGASAAPSGETDVPDMFRRLQDTEASEVAEILRATDLNTLSPIEAMNLLFSLKK
ncbi:MAG: DNA mismatch repair protein MutS, partial [Clostridia bacterium]|nr:DNA mismatch repair protein MutS [Clostridia bacterium]